MGLFFLREIPSKEALIGIIIIILGVQIIKQKSFSFIKIIPNFRGIKSIMLVPAVLTAFFSGCYSIIDKKAVLFMDPILFFYLFFAFSGFLFLVYLLALKKRRKRYFKILNKDKSRIFVAAILEFASYILILYAFRISKAAYVIALRQLSVIFGSLFGIWFLKERYGKIRIIGSLVIFVGIFLIAVFG
jgi:drug/metabolite transporter (DMT)-like permease